MRRADPRKPRRLAGHAARCEVAARVLPMARSSLEMNTARAAHAESARKNRRVAKRKPGRLNLQHDRSRKCRWSRVTRILVHRLAPWSVLECRVAAPLQMNATNSAIFTLEQHGLIVADVHHNLPPSALYEHAIRFEKDASIAENGALVAYSGIKTGRSPKDKRVVEHPA